MDISHCVLMCLGCIVFSYCIPVWKADVDGACCSMLKYSAGNLH